MNNIVALSQLKAGIMAHNSILLVGDNRWLIKALWLLVESEPKFSVIGSCTIQDVIVLSQHVFPDIILFLPEIFFVSYQEPLSQIHSMLPQSGLIVITPVDAAIYETIIRGKNSYRFISQSSLNTDLLPTIWNTLNEKQQTELGYRRDS